MKHEFQTLNRKQDEATREQEKEKGATGEEEEEEDADAKRERALNAEILEHMGEDGKADATAVPPPP